MFSASCRIRSTCRTSRIPRPRYTRPLPARTVILLVLLVLFCAVAIHQIVANRAWDGPFYYDEADYRYAANQGFLANWTDTPSLPIGEFLAAGWQARQGGGNRTSLSRLIRDANDIHSYRHWHGPLYFQLIANITSASESENRQSAVWFILAGALVALFGGRLLFGERQGWWVGAFGALAWALSATLLRTLEVAPHTLFAVVSCAAMTALGIAASQHRRDAWWIGIGLTALSFCVMELAFAGIASALLTGFLYRRELSLSLRDIGLSLLVFAGTVLVFWPGTIFTLSFIRSYAAMVYLAVFRANAWGDLTLAQAWGIRLLDTPLEWILILLGAILFFRVSPRLRAAVLPSAVFGLVMFLATLRVNAEGPRYLVPYLPVWITAAVWLLAATHFPSTRAHIFGFAALAVALSLNLAFAFSRHPVVPSQPKDWTVIRAVRDLPTGTILLVPGDYVPILHYYAPAVQIRRCPDNEPCEAALARGEATSLLTEAGQVVNRPN